MSVTVQAPVAPSTASALTPPASAPAPAVGIAAVISSPAALAATAIGSPATIGQTNFPVPDALLANIPTIPNPAFVPTSWLKPFEAGGGGFVVPPTDKGLPVPVDIETFASGGAASIDGRAVDVAFTQFQADSFDSDFAEAFVLPQGDFATTD